MNLFQVPFVLEALFFAPHINTHAAAAIITLSIREATSLHKIVKPVGKYS